MLHNLIVHRNFPGAIFVCNSIAKNFGQNIDQSKIILVSQIAQNMSIRLKLSFKIWQLRLRYWHLQWFSIVKKRLKAYQLRHLGSSSLCFGLCILQAGYLF